MNKEEEKIHIKKAQKDLSEFSHIYNEYVKDVYRYVYSLIKNKEIAEDITQETFTKALENIKTFTWQDISIKNWFLAIARNLVYKSGRKYQFIESNEEVEEIEDLAINTGETNFIVEKELRDCLFSLPDTTREIIILKIWEEYKFSEIAEILEINENTVKSQFYRGITYLRKELEKKGHKKDTIILPVIFASISRLSKSETFLPSDQLVTSLAEKLIETSKLSKISKFNNINSMNKLFGAISKQAWIAIGVVSIITVGSVSTILLLNKKEDTENLDSDRTAQEENRDNNENDTDDSNLSENNDENNDNTQDNSQTGQPNSQIPSIKTLSITHNMVDITTGQETGQKITARYPENVTVVSDKEYISEEGPIGNRWYGYIRFNIREATLSIAYYTMHIVCADEWPSTIDTNIGTIAGKETVRFYDQQFDWYLYLGENTGCEGGYMTFPYDQIEVRLSNVPEANKAEIMQIADQIVLSIVVE